MTAFLENVLGKMGARQSRKSFLASSFAWTITCLQVWPLFFVFVLSFFMLL